MEAVRDDRGTTLAGPTAQVQSFAGGRYAVRRLIGEGGQKVVFLAHDTQLDRDVAISWLKSERLDEDGVARVRREARAMARLGAQPHIVAIYDIGEHEGRPFTICEYMPGGDLHQAIQRADGHLSLEQALQIAQDLCEALVVAHEQGILHRDIKPENVWLTDEGRAKLGDFGLAMALGRTRMTQTGTIMGTAAYMPPEQALGGEVDARSDLYALGCLLYELLTGRPPFLGDDTIAIVSQHINTAPVAPSWHRPNLPQALERLTLRLLAKAPDERPKSAAEALAVLEAIAVAPRDTTVPREEANPLDRLAGGVFVGREQELDEVCSSLDEAVSGHGRLVLLAGEPGIGKTRLAEEVATYAQLRGAQVLWGRCYEGEGAPAYWPWVQAIRSYVYGRAPETLLSELGTGAADIAQIVSEVRERLPGLPPPPALEPEQARFRLFDSITTFLKNAARAQPLMLVLDDLHWSDKPSLLLLEFLARELRDARFLVLGSYRDVELGRQHPLSHSLAELAREQLSQRVVLRGLGEGDVARFIEMTAGIEPSAGLVTAVYKETEGNPFFVKEVVSLLAAERRLDQASSAAFWSITIPQSVREVLGRRLDQLSGECNQALTIASVIGREFGLQTLERVGDLSGDRLLDVLDEALAGRVIVEEPRAVGRYSFSHALIRETLYEELRATRRVRLHRQIAEALEALYGKHPEPHLAELAYHFCQAAPGGDAEKAIDYARRAGERAAASYASEEAMRLFQMALEALDTQDKPDEEMHCKLLIALGGLEVGEAASHGPVGRERLQKAAVIARKIKSPELLARAALEYGRTFQPGTVEPDHVDFLTEALAALTDEQHPLRWQLLSRLSMALYWADRRETSFSLAQEAIEVARRSEDAHALGLAILRRYFTLWLPEELEQRSAAADEVLRLGEGADDRELACSARIGRVLSRLEVGDADADADSTEVDRLAADLRAPRHLWSAALLRVVRALRIGRFYEAEPLMEQALAIGRREHPETAGIAFGIQLMLLRREQARAAELETPVKNFVSTITSVPGFRCVLALFYAELGREAECREEFEPLAARDFGDLPRDYWWIVSVALLAEVAIYLRDSDRMSVLYELLLPFDGRIILIPQILVVFLCYGPVARQLGLLAAAMGRPDDAIRHFSEALQQSQRAGARPWVAHTQYDQARALLARGGPDDREQALDLLAQALDAAREMGMKSLVDKIEALQTQARR